MLNYLIEIIVQLLVLLDIVTHSRKKDQVVEPANLDFYNIRKNEILPLRHSRIEIRSENPSGLIHGGGRPVVGVGQARKLILETN